MRGAVQVSGEVTYNGYGLDEFVPQKTAAYISQTDVHVGEMTVKETLDFSARCQGVGTKYGMTEQPFQSLDHERRTMARQELTMNISMIEQIL